MIYFIYLICIGFCIALNEDYIDNRRVIVFGNISTMKIIAKPDIKYTIREEDNTYENYTTSSISRYNSTQTYIQFDTTVKWNYSQPACDMALCKYNYTYSNSMISGCYCDVNCLQFGDCCLDYEIFKLRGQNDTESSPEKYKSDKNNPFSDYYQNVEKRNYIKTTCTLFNVMILYKYVLVNNTTNVKLIDYCPTSTDKSGSSEDIRLCQAPVSEHWSGLHIPVKRNLKFKRSMFPANSLIDFFFKNIHCARCHGFKDKYFKTVQIYVKCEDKSKEAYDIWRLYGIKHFQEFARIHCRIEVDILSLLKNLVEPYRHYCLLLHNSSNTVNTDEHSITCPITTNNINLNRVRLFQLCRNYKDEFNYNYKRYDNRHCFLCYSNERVLSNILNNCQMRIQSDPGPEPEPWYPSFRIILDPTAGIKIFLKNKSLCRAFNYRNGKCIKNTCPASHVRISNGLKTFCMPVHIKRVDQLLENKSDTHHFVYFHLSSRLNCIMKTKIYKSNMLSDYLLETYNTTFINGKLLDSNCMKSNHNSRSIMNRFFANISSLQSSEYIDSFCLKFQIDKINFIKFISSHDIMKTTLYRIKEFIESTLKICPGNIVDSIMLSTSDDSFKINECKYPLKTTIRDNLTLNGYNFYNNNGYSKQKPLHPNSIYDRETLQVYSLSDIPFVYKVNTDGLKKIIANERFYKMFALLCEPEILSCTTYTFLPTEYSNYTNGIIIFGNKIANEYLTRIDYGVVIICDFRIDFNGPENLHVEGIITTIGLIISILSLLATIMVYIIIPKLRRNSPSASSILGLCLTLALAQILFLVSGFPAGFTCIAIAAMQHFAWLSSFCWSNVLAYRIHRALTSMVMPEYGRWYIYIFALLVPSVLILILIILHISGSQIFSYGNSDFTSICFIESVGLTMYGYSLQKLITFNLPILASLTANIYFFTRTIYFLKTSINNSNPIGTGERESFKIFMKLTSLMGFTWLSGEAALIPGLSFLWIVFIVLNSLQGFYIFASFGWRAGMNSSHNSVPLQRQLNTISSNIQDSGTSGIYRLTV